MKKTIVKRRLDMVKKHNMGVSLQHVVSDLNRIWRFEDLAYPDWQQREK